MCHVERCVAAVSSSVAMMTSYVEEVLYLQWKTWDGGPTASRVELKQVELVPAMEKHHIVF